MNTSRWSASDTKALRRQSSQVEEQEFLRKREVFSQQSITHERPHRIRQQQLRRVKPDGANTVGGAYDRRRVGRVVGEGDRDRMIEDGLVELVSMRRLRADEKPQALGCELRQRHPLGGAPQAQPQHPGGAGRGRVGRRNDRPTAQGDRLDLDRPQRHRVGGAEAAGVALHRTRVDQGSRLHLERRGEVGAGRQFDDRHRRDRRQIMRVEDFQQALRQLREIVVELAVDAGGDEGEALQQPLDVRIVGGFAGKAQPAGDLRMLLGEFGGQLAQIAEFAVVVGVQLVKHRAAPARSRPGSRDREPSRRRSAPAPALPARAPRCESAACDRPVRHRRSG